MYKLFWVTATTTVFVGIFTHTQLAQEKERLRGERVITIMV